MDKAFESWVESATLAGDLTPAELENLPSQGIGTPFLMKLWTEMYAQLSEDSSACKTAQDSFQTWTSFQINSEFAQEITINPEILPEINLASDRLIDQYNTCFKGRNKSVYVLLSKILGIPAGDLENIPDIQDLASVYGSGATPMDGLQKLVKPARDSMMEIEKNYPLKAYQFFSEEEHADDVSLIVHKHLGWDQLSLVNFFRLLLSEDARQKCDALLKAGTLPPGGSFSDPHRATCYRMSHIVDLKNAYQKMDSRAFAADYISKTIQP